MEKRMTKKMVAAARNSKGEPRADGPRCATCGDLALWGTHPRCRKEYGCLVVEVTK